PQKQEAPKKQEKPAPKKTDPVAAALQQARKASSRAQSGDRGNAIEQALAQAQRRAGGNRGGGGGEGDGPGGGGLGDVYMGQVMLAVRPNWGFASAGRLNLACAVRVKVDMQGQVLQAVISQSSGNAQYDASAVNAIIRTGQAGEFPPPPSPEYMDLDLVFTFDELMGRR
ncbi:cell envelope integrity protein TolA, partial [uncultured Desulfovibrio sp.]|uniref:cell envelope integrity protein TolA n=1 Tax=uncultured Desulfovibrio sp. TaxID=167968 RepID=UPI00260D1E54